MTDSVQTLLIYGGTFVVGVGGFVALRFFREWKWNQLLNQSMRSLKSVRGTWKKTLSKKLSFHSNGTLFESVYSQLCESNSDPLSEELVSLLGETETDSVRTESQEDPILLIKRLNNPKPLSEQDRIQNLVNLPSYQSESAAPVQAVATNLLVNFVHVVKRKKRFATAVEHTVLDSFAPGGGFAGAKVAGVLALALSPVSSGFMGAFSAWLSVKLVWGTQWLSQISSYGIPVCMILGAAMGSFLGKKLANRVKSRKSHRARKTLQLVSKNFRSSFLQRVPDLMRELDQYLIEKSVSIKSMRRQHQNIVLRLMYPDLMTVAFSRSIRQINDEKVKRKAEWNLIRKKVRAMSPVEFASSEHQIDEDLFSPYPVLRSYYLAYEAAVHELQTAVHDAESKQKEAA